MPTHKNNAAPIVLTHKNRNFASAKHDSFLVVIIFLIVIDFHKVKLYFFTGHVPVLTLRTYFNYPFAVEGYANDGQIGIDELLVPAYTHGKGSNSSYKYSEQEQHMASQTNCLIEETISSFSNATISAVADTSGIAAPVDEPVGEPARHTYASIVLSFSVL